MSEESMVDRVATAIKNAGTPERWSFSDIIFDAFDDRYHDEAMTDVSVALARVAIEAMKDVPLDALGAMYEAMFEDKWDCSQAPMVGAGWDAAIDFFLNEKA